MDGQRPGACGTSGALAAADRSLAVYLAFGVLQPSTVIWYEPLNFVAELNLPSKKSLAGTFFCFLGLNDLIEPLNLNLPSLILTWPFFGPPSDVPVHLLPVIGLSLVLT